jgi:hypothetical protein
MLKRVRWPAEDCFCTGLMVITSSLSLPAVGGKKWSTIWCSLIGIEWRKISSRLRMRPSFTRRPNLVTGIHLRALKSATERRVEGVEVDATDYIHTAPSSSLSSPPRPLPRPRPPVRR